MSELLCLKCYNNHKHTALIVTDAISDIDGCYDGVCPVCWWRIWNFIPSHYQTRPDFKAIDQEGANHQ
jgi:hypothetical protein